MTKNTVEKSLGETKSHWSRLSDRQSQLRLLMLEQNSPPETMLFPSTSPAVLPDSFKKKNHDHLIYFHI